MITFISISQVRQSACNMPSVVYRASMHFSSVTRDLSHSHTFIAKTSIYTCGYKLCSESACG